MKVIFDKTSPSWFSLSVAPSSLQNGDAVLAQQWTSCMPCIDSPACCRATKFLAIRRQRNPVHLPMGMEQVAALSKTALHPGGPAAQHLCRLSLLCQRLGDSRHDFASHQPCRQLASAAGVTGGNSHA